MLKKRLRKFLAVATAAACLCSSVPISATDLGVVSDTVAQEITVETEAAVETEAQAVAAETEAQTEVAASQSGTAAQTEASVQTEAETLAASETETDVQEETAAVSETEAQTQAETAESEEAQTDAPGSETEAMESETEEQTEETVAETETEASESEAQESETESEETIAESEVESEVSFEMTEAESDSEVIKTVRVQADATDAADTEIRLYFWSLDTSDITLPDSTDQWSDYLKDALDAAEPEDLDDENKMSLPVTLADGSASEIEAQYVQEYKDDKLDSVYLAFTLPVDAVMDTEIDLIVADDAEIEDDIHLFLAAAAHEDDEDTILCGLPLVWSYGALVEAGVVTGETESESGLLSSVMAVSEDDEDTGNSDEDAEDGAITVSHTSDGGTITLSLNPIKNSDNEADTDFLTGEYAFTTVQLMNKGSTSNSSVSRIYIQFSDSDGAVYSGDSSGSTSEWTVGSTKTFTSNGVTFYVTLCQAEGLDNLYYLEIDSIEAGATFEFTFATTYPNVTSDGGTATIYAEITEDPSEDGSPSESEHESFTASWTMQEDTYSVTKSNSDSSTFTYDSSSDTIYLGSLYYYINTTKTSSGSSYGKDYIETCVYTDTLTLPEGLAWRDGLVEAVKNDDWRFSNGYLYVTIDGTEYIFCRGSYSLSSVLSSYVDSLSLSVDADDNIVVTITLTQNDESYDMTGRQSLYFYSNMIAVTDSVEDLSGGKTYTITNAVDTEYTFNYSDETQESAASVTRNATLNDGELTLTKSSSGSWLVMGTAKSYTITASNSEAMPYYSLRYLEDAMSNWLYLEPDEMEDLLDTYHDLTITITGAALYDTITRDVTTTDGTEVTIDWSMIGNSSSYTGEEATNGGISTGTLASSDTAKAEDVTITFAWADEDLVMTLSTGKSYVIGTDYDTIADALDAIGYFVTSSAVYSLVWDLGEDYVLTGSSSISYTYNATVKDTFMLLDGDLCWNLLQNYGISSTTAVTSINVNTVTAYGSDYGTDSAESLASAQVTKDIYLDFSLWKEMSVSRDDEILSDTNSLTVGDIITYSVNVNRTNNNGFSYSGLPLVDKLSPEQVLLVPVDKNTQLAESGLSTITVDDTEYYLLTNGTYSDVYINSSVIADTVEVTDDGTMVYCYLNISGGSSGTVTNGTTTISYLAMVDPSSGSFTVSNQVWLNDHETHRLYDAVAGEGSALNIEKKIVTSKGSVPGNDTTVDSLVLKNVGTEVTYRLKLQNKSDSVVKVTGADIYDALPANVSGDAWTADDIVISIASDGEVLEDLSGWTTGWSITSVEPGSDGAESADVTQYYLVWDDDLSLTFTGSVYIYVTLTFPDGDAWNTYVDEYSSADLTNVLHVFSLSSQVSHTIAAETKASLCKGVMETGLTGGMSSSAALYPSDDEDSLWYYADNSAGKYGYVQYYVVLYNEGATNLYLNTLTHVLPYGFSSGTTASRAVSTTDLTVKDSEGNDLVCKTFDIAVTYSELSSGTKISFDLSGGDLGYSDTTGMYYLAPGEAAVFTYYAYAYYVYGGVVLRATSDEETNVIAMPFYDYNGGGISLSDDVSAETVSWDTDMNRNDGTVELWTSDQATENGISGSSDYYLASSVTVYRGQIKPGIEKTVTSETAGSNETVEWSIKVTNDGDAAMYDYYIYDVIESPYVFDGDITYTVYDADGDSRTHSLCTISNVDLDAMTYSMYYYTGSKWTTRTGTIGESTGTYSLYVCANKNYAYTAVYIGMKINSDGDLVLTVRLAYYSGTTANWVARSKMYYSIPSGGYGVLTVHTSSDSDTNYNGVISNAAYIRPTQTFDEGNIGMGTEILATDGDINVGSSHAVEDEASVAVSYGYSTTSKKSVTELDSSEDETDNTAGSASKDVSITLASASSMFRYGLSVFNGYESMDKLVILDNLPETDDTMTLTDSARKSDFKVSFAEDPKFEVTVTLSDDTSYTLEEGTDYYIEYSTSSTVSEADLDVSGESDVVWTSEFSTDARSFRIVFIFNSEDDYIPAYATVTVSFNAVVDDDSVEPGAIAYNSFAYLYSASTSAYDLSASPRKVGVKVPTAPKLVKKVLDSDGTTEASLEEDTTYSFLIYEGDVTITGDTEDELIASMYENGITSFTKAEATVTAGESASDAVTLYNLTEYVITEDGESYTVTADGTWTWTDGAEYSIVEIPDADCTFSSWHVTLRTNHYAFTYGSASNLTLACYNTIPYGSITLTKVDSNDSSIVLSDAVFTIYSDADCTEVVGTMTTDADGIAAYEDLPYGTYYVVETTAPDGYIGSSQVYEAVVDSTTPVNIGEIPNTAGRAMPVTGGIGTMVFYLIGIVLVAGAGGTLVYRRKRRKTAE